MLPRDADDFSSGALLGEDARRALDDWKAAMGPQRDVETTGVGASSAIVAGRALRGWVRCSGPSVGGVGEAGVETTVGASAQPAVQPSAPPAPSLDAVGAGVLVAAVVAAGVPDASFGGAEPVIQDAPSGAAEVEADVVCRDASGSDAVALAARGDDAAKRDKHAAAAEARQEFSAQEAMSTYRKRRSAAVALAARRASGAGANAELAPAGSSAGEADSSSASTVVTPLRVCSFDRHVCGPCDVERGCSSCALTCHVDCTSELCALEPCPYCVSWSRVAHVNSALCKEVQMNGFGCHACGRFGCWLGSGSCHAKCTANVHVCGPGDRVLGCDDCGRVCHRTSADPRCPYHGRARGVVPWSASAQDLLDTQAGTGGSVPHRSQMPWEFRDRARIEITVDGVQYRRGFGNPGRHELGERNNCLIDSLRQCLGHLECDRMLVRQDLQREFADEDEDDPRRFVSGSSFLDVECHWQAILRSLFLHNRSGRSTQCDVEEYCVVALDGNRPGHGVVLGNVNAPNRLVVVNWDDVHFDPCLR